MAYSYTFTGAGTPSTILRSDGHEFAQDPSSLAFQGWLSFTAAGGETTGAPAFDLDAYKIKAKEEIRRRATDARDAAIRAEFPEIAIDLQIIAEAQDWAKDGSPTEGEYPLLAAEIGARGATLEDVALEVLGDLESLKLTLAGFEATRAAQAALADAGSDASEVDTAVEQTDFTVGDLKLFPTRALVSTIPPEVYRVLLLAPDPAATSSAAPSATAVLGPLVPTFIAAGALAAANDEDVDLGLPAGAGPGMILLAIVNSDAGPLTPAGWTAGPSGEGGGLCDLYTFWRRASASEASPVTFGGNGATGQVGVVLAFDGCATSGNPIGASGLSEHNEASATIDAGTVTPPANNCGVLFVGTGEDPISLPTASGYTGTDPTFVEVFDGGAESPTLLVFLSIHVAFDVQATAAATGARAATLSQTSNANVGLMLALSPI